MSEEIGPIRLEILWSGLLSITEEMSIALKRTAYSELVREANDFSCAIFDASGNMLAQTDWIGSPGHLGSIPGLVKNALKEYPPESLQQGDVITTNDPFLGSGHLNDICIITPIFDRGKLLAFAVNIAHHADIGGRVAGGHIADSRSIFEEGIRIPLLKISKAGKLNEDLLKMISANVRRPYNLSGDLKAQMSANYVGAKRLIEYIKDNELEDLTPLATAIIDATEREMRGAISKLLSGRYSDEDYMDGLAPGKPLKLRLTMEIEGDKMRLDWTGTSPQVELGINSVYNYTHAYTIHAIKGALAPTSPYNEGTLRPIEVYAPEGTIVNPKPPAPLSSRHILSWHVSSLVFKVLSQVAPDRVLAAPGGTGGNMPQVSGIDPRTGKPFIHVAIHAGGLGARPNVDGIHTFSFPPRAENIPIEVVETENPIIFERFELLPDSAGPGKYRGGCGSIIGFRVVTEKPFTVANTGDRFEYAASGLFGGKEGSKATFILNPGRPDERSLNPRATHVLEPGSSIEYTLPGGGGYGNPFKRDPAAVLEDVKNGIVSIERAKTEYGVVIDPGTMTVNFDETEKLRKAAVRRRS
jgi:N-methylhydantoinase B